MGNRKPTTRHSDLVRELRTFRMTEWRDRVRSRPVPDHVHGTVNGYTSYGCRCEFCKAAQSERNRRQYQERKRRANETEETA